MDVNEIVKEIKKLSSHDRKALSKQLGFPSPDRMVDARIRISDWEGNDRNRPRATVILADGTHEDIDILEALNFNVMSIGHPAILSAIGRWTEIIRYHRTFSENSCWQIFHRDKTSGGYICSELISRRDLYKIVRNHLTRVSSDFAGRAEKNSFSKAAAVEIQRIIDDMGAIELLRKTYELLDDVEIKKTKNSALRLGVLVRKLEAFNRVVHKNPVVIGSYSVGKIIEFLKAPEGERFLFDRSRWSAFKASFEAWHFSLNKDTLRKYRSEAHKEFIRKGVRTFSNFPDLKCEFSLSELDSMLSVQTIPTKDRK